MIEELKENEGVYLLINKKASNIIAYVGQSKSKKDRLSSHNRDFKAFTKVDLENEQLNKYEAAAYHLIKNEYKSNTAHPPYKNCDFCKVEP